jgi:DNA-binding NarL/FixJ family response regulator
MSAPVKTSQINVMIVEDDHYLRTVTVEALVKHKLNVIGSSSNSRQAMIIAKNNKPDIAILDIDLGGGPTGVDLAHALSNLYPDIGFVFLTSYKDPRFAGAAIPELPTRSAYLTKQTLKDINILIDTVNDMFQKTQSNKFWQSGSFVDEREKRNFTDVQIELMQLISAGHSNSQIAAEKSISIKSVETSISRLAKKLEIPNTPDNSQRVLIAKKYASLIGK